MTAIDRSNDPRARLILCWLPILSLDQDLMVVNGQPVLTNWGLVPRGTMEFTDKLAHRLMHGLGQFLPEGVDVPDVADLIAVEHRAEGQTDADGSEADTTSSAPVTAIPPVSAASQDPESPASPSGPVSPVFAGAAHQQAQAASMAADQQRPTPPLPEAQAARRSPRCWLPVLIACIVALLFLLLLLLPGILVFPNQSTAQAMLGNLALEQSEAALRNRIKDLKSELANRSCRAPRPLPDLSAVTPSGTAPATPVDPATPAQPTVTDVVTLLDQATVLIVAGDGTRKMGSGSGFFIGPDLIVTNRHVVEASNEGHVIVVNKALGGARKGQVIATSANSNLGEQDYALVRMIGAPFSHHLSLSKSGSKGQQIYAAGYPSIFMETDEHFLKLLAGVVTAAPDMVLTQGIVTVLQDSPSGNRMVLHSADISPGNSGGPLADKCGRVIGVNTFVKTSSEQQVRLNFALKSDSLLSFLSAQGVNVDQQDAACEANAPPSRQAEAAE
ncbi:trypsin-like peptidase domain-containing protein [Cohaesibacter intestini]|uniref:trypsin-like peptidase domain-containing protein n=1 Tax=Cohaesibacter intestini TaxID=2211145 RepID=UPI00130027EF|nr:trypsin-like peptidase domain-containing protein [Cohaesibacter intestini]